MKGFNKANVYVDGVGIINTSISFYQGKIQSVTDDCDEEIFSLPTGAVIVPGFIDQHVHGAGGFDAMDGDGESLKKMAKALAKEGTTAFLPTTMTQKNELILKALSTINGLIGPLSREGAQILGTHLEGPFISPEHAGAQPKEYVIEPDEKAFDDFFEAAGGNIRIVTLAPERQGAKKLIQRLSALGVRVSLGHTAAKFEDISVARDLGATAITHTFNAQSGLHHRNVGTVGGALIFDDLYCELIADKIHVSPAAMKILIKNKPKDKIILITDSLRNKHLPDGISELGGQKVIVKGGEARLEDGTLAGSVLKMNEAVKNIVGLGVSFTDAVDFATKNPAKHLGIFDEYGSILPGKRADLTVLSADTQVLLTIREGNIIYSAFN